MRTINGIEIDDFTYAYIVAALWSSNDESEPNGGKPLDQNYGPEDIDPDTLRTMASECADFRGMEWKGKTVAEWMAAIDRPHKKRCADGEEYGTDELDGHDFWLNRNGHGAGFWDRGYGKIGTILSDAAHTYGTVDLYVSDGKIFQQ